MISNIKDLLIVKDNFFKENVYKEILKDISRLKFDHLYGTEDANNVYQNIYFSVPLNVDHFAVQEVNRLLNNFGFNLHGHEHAYFLSTKHEEATPHRDSVDLNCLIYLKGKHLINSGTGFYEKKENEYALNRHVGFKENRALIFDSKIFHSSLQFNEGAGKRYVMANFFKYKNNL